MYACVCIHTYMHAYIHAYIHTYMHTYMIFQQCKCVCGNKLFDIHACMPTYIHTYTYIHAYLIFQQCKCLCGDKLFDSVSLALLKGIDQLMYVYVCRYACMQVHTKN